MSDKPRDKGSRWALAAAIFAFVSLGYFYSIAHRLDWIRYVTEPYYWRVQAMSCPNKKPEPVVVLSDSADASPKHVITYAPELARYLKTLPPKQPVNVEIRRKGYLWEFNYGEQFVLSIGTKGIYPGWRKTADQLKDCNYEPVTVLDPTILMSIEH